MLATMGEGDGSTKATEIDIAKLESSLLDRMSPEHAFGAFKSCIYKTPEILKRHKPDSYTPHAFSIGPMHHGDPNLTEAEKIKSLYLREFLARSTAFTLTAVIKVVQNLEANARACYAEGVKFTREKLVEILVVDGCFLIELLHRSGSGPDPSHPDDPIRTQASMLQYLYHDLVLLENQIPWIVFDGLFNATIKEGPRKSTLKTLVVCFFAHHFSATNPLRQPSDPNYECKHILDLIRESLISPFGRRVVTNRWKRTPPAVELRQAGVKLAGAVNLSTILDVKFVKEKGRLEIPHVLIMETTEATFRNLISYEQCYPGCKSIVTSYAILMDNLANRPRDLEVLCDEGIVENWLDPQVATRMLNFLYNDANVTDFNYFQLSDDLGAYCRRWWSAYRIWYLQNFTTPLATVTQVAGALGLSFTLLQTVFSIPGLGSKN